MLELLFRNLHTWVSTFFYLLYQPDDLQDKYHHNHYNSCYPFVNQHLPFGERPPNHQPVINPCSGFCTPHVSPGTKNRPLGGRAGPSSELVPSWRWLTWGGWDGAPGVSLGLFNTGQRCQGPLTFNGRNLWGISF